MKRLLATSSALCLGALAFGQSVVGTWLPDAESTKTEPYAKDLTITLVKGGKMTFKGFNTVGEGHYTISGKTVTIVLDKRNGVKPKTAKESTTTLTITEGGKALIVDMGFKKNDQPVTVRLVRKR